MDNVYILFTVGDDGIFVMDTFASLEAAQHALERNISIQNEIEGRGKEVYIDYHSHERLRVPMFHFRDEDILSHLTLNIRDKDDKVWKTDRFIVRSILER